MKALSIALAGALLATASAASAQTAADAQCIVVSNVFAGQAKDPQAQKMAEASLYFYLGRISSQITSAQLKALLDAQMKTLTKENAGAAMDKCTAAIQAKITMLQSLGGPPKAATTPAKPVPGKAPPGR